MDPGGIQHPGRSVQRVGPEYQRQGDSRNGLPPVPGDRNAVGGSIQETYDGSGAFLTGEAEGSGTLNGVRGRDGAQVSDGPRAGAAWEGIGWETALGNHGPEWGATYLHNGLPDCWGPRKCPIEGCPGWEETSTAMRFHFFHRHVRDTIIILEEGNLPHPWRPQCDMLVP